MNKVDVLLDSTSSLFDSGPSTCNQTSHTRFISICHSPKAIFKTSDMKHVFHQITRDNSHARLGVFSCLVSREHYWWQHSQSPEVSEHTMSSSRWYCLRRWKNLPNYRICRRVILSSNSHSSFQLSTHQLGHIINQIYFLFLPGSRIMRTPYIKSYYEALKKNIAHIRWIFGMIWGRVNLRPLQRNIFLR